MRAIVASIILAAAVSGTTLAQAGNSQKDPTIAVDVMKQKIDAYGYDVLGLKLDGDLFRTHLVDRRNGGFVKGTFNAATGELVQASAEAFPDLPGWTYPDAPGWM